MPKVYIDLTGYESKFYVVLRAATKEEASEFGFKNNSRFWLCQCICGNLFISTTTWIQKDLKQSCGCIRAARISKSKSEDLTNQQFNMLTAKYLIGQDKARHNIWHCICKCGQEIDALATNLKTGHTKSCGCEKSFGEKYICDKLTELGVKSIRQYTFEDLKGIGGSLLMFDFAFKDSNGNLIGLLEYQGIQHFQYTPKTAYFGYQQREYTDKQKKGLL